MKKLIFAALVTTFLIPGCVVAVESRHPRHSPPPPPPPPPPAQVTVEWHDSRTVVLREYYDCDWDTVGAFEYYEDVCGIPEDDLFFLLHVSRVGNRSFHEVVYTYDSCNRVLWDVCLRYRINHWDLYVDLPYGTVCPPAYHRAYGYYWIRHQNPRFVLTNYDCHALFWLRFSVNYYGWQPRDCFTRWDQCVDTRVRYVTVVNREYVHAGRGGYNWARRPVVKVIERPERNRTVIIEKRKVVKNQSEMEVRRLGSQGQKVIRTPSREERDRRVQEDRRHVEVEWKKEREERDREPHKYGPPPPKHDDKKFDDRRDDRKDERDDRKDVRKNPPPPPKKNPPPPPKNDKKDGDGKPDERKDDREDRKDERKEPPPPPKKNPPPPPKDDKKDEKKDDNRKDEREDRRDDRKDERKEPPPPPKKNPPPPPKDDKKDQDQRKNDDQRNNQRRPPPPPPPKEKKQDEKREERNQDSSGKNRQGDRQRK